MKLSWRKSYYIKKSKYEFRFQSEIPKNCHQNKKNKFCLWEWVDILCFTCYLCDLHFTSKFCGLPNEMLGGENESVGLGVWKWNTVGL